MRERWRVIPGFGGQYKVSDHGRVWWGAGREYIVSQSWSGPGRYPRVGLMYRGKSTSCTVHRLVAKAFVPNPDGKPEVNHEDGDKDNNHYQNLTWMTRKENQRHAIEVLGVALNRVGLKGEDHGMARLKNKDVRKIIKRLDRGDRQVDIAATYGITQVMVSRIKRGKAWTHITGR